MSGASSRASKQALFAAREFVARYERETASVLPDAVADLARFAYEMGYLRGRSIAAEEALKMFSELSPVRDEARKAADDDSKSK
jgi:CRISPR/Cas system CSM-associated protein Csm2 small subunit